MFGLKQFRRRQLFNFTLTELILLILFILLLFLWLKIVDLEKKNAICEAGKDECGKTLVKFQEGTGVLNPEDIPDDYSICSAAIRNKNLTERQLLEKITQLELLIEQLQNELAKFKDVTGFDNPEDVPGTDQELIEIINELENKNDVLEIENNLLKEKIFKLEKQIQLLKEKISELEKQIELLTGEIEKINEDLKKCTKNNALLKGEGIGLPPCWPSGWKESHDISLYEDQSKPTYIFTIRLQEEGIWVSKDFHPEENFINQYNKLSTNNIKFEVPISAQEFINSMSDLLVQSNLENENDLNITQSRQCRHSVRIFNEIPDARGALPQYEKMMKAIENNFHIYKFEDSYDEYINKFRK
jgi:hypothetical protein